MATRNTVFATPLDAVLRCLHAHKKPTPAVAAALRVQATLPDAVALIEVVEAWAQGVLRGAAVHAAADAALDFPSRRLLVYGSLAPGECHDDVLASIPGRWLPAKIQGEIDRTGNYPRFTWRPGGPVHTVQCFAAPTLPAHWPRLDFFEGEGYRRIWISAQVDGEQRVASIYEAV